MSASTVLYSIHTNLFRFGGPALICLGSVSCILNLLVFTKHSLRKNPCAICFVMVSIVNFLFCCLIVLVTTLDIGYAIDPSSGSIHFCRFRFYVGYVLSAWEPNCLILASIDRMLVTSTKADTRKLSSRRLVSISLLACGCFWLVFHIHAMLFMQIQEFGPNYFVCYYQAGAYTVFITYYLLLINGLLPPVLLAIFGCWTINNVRRANCVAHQSRTTNAATAVVGRPATLRAKDHQLIRMLLVDILIYVICKTPLAIFYIYQQITQYKEKSSAQESIEQSIMFFTYFTFFIEPSISAYTNIFVSKTFRKEIKRVFLRQRH